jgi:uncharacterized integral membrane protein
VAFRYLIVALLASGITVFALQNTIRVSVRFMVWSLELPLAGVILGSVAAGIVLVGLPLSFDRWRARARARTLERRLAAIEAERAEEARVAVSPPPAPPSPPPADTGRHGRVIGR